jgi:hypothetical protein
LDRAVGAEIRAQGAAVWEVGPMKPDTEVTEVQQFGLSGFIFTAAAVLGFLYAIFKAVGWLAHYLRL